MFSSLSPLKYSSTRPNSWAGRCVRSRERVVNVDLDRRIRRLVGAREADQRTRVAIATILNSQLRARQVELGAANGARAVQGNVLNAHEVVA